MQNYCNPGAKVVLLAKYCDNFLKKCALMVGFRNKLRTFAK